MNLYWRYWKRGWWSWLMQLCQNLIGLAFFLPLALLFRENQVAYLLSASLVGLVLLVPLAGWLFEAFAAKSERITRDHQAPSDPPA
jgi:hypothetical protein